MCAAIKENKYMTTKYLDQRQDQDLLQSLFTRKEENNQKKYIMAPRNPKIQFKGVKQSILN